MKKGFLTSGATPKSNELVEISRRKPGGEKDFRILDEVQQVIKEEQQAKSEASVRDLMPSSTLLHLNDRQLVNGRSSQAN
jgi:hypothetical protein